MEEPHIKPGRRFHSDNLNRESQNAVENKKQGGRCSRNSAPTKMEEAHTRNQEILHHRIEWSRMTQSLDSRDCHSPGEISNGTVELLIQKIPEPAKGESERCGYDCDVQETPEIHCFSLREEEESNSDSNESAVKRHPPPPHGEDFPRVISKIV